MPENPIAPQPGGDVVVTDAHLHNLKHVNVRFPRNQVVAFTGVSGSGKSSLAFGTIHGEAQRRYLESVAPFARRLIGAAVDPQVEAITGMPPTVALEQRTSAGGARSSVGTITALSNTLRLVFSRAGHHPPEILDAAHQIHGGHLSAGHFSPNTAEGMCPTCHGTGTQLIPDVEKIIPDENLSILDGAIAAWPGAWLGKNFREILETIGVDTSLPWKELPEETREWILFTEETPTLTVAPVREAWRTQETYQGQWRSVTKYLRDTAEGSGSERNRNRALSFFTTVTCPTCAGHKLNHDALKVSYLGDPIWHYTSLPLEELARVLSERAGQVRETPESEDSPEQGAERLLLPTALPVLDTAVRLGLGHLSMDRPANSLSTGELQRLRLASQLRSGLFGVAYVLDEPSAGLHPSEKQVLTELFQRFVDEGNSVLIVEHDMNLVETADWIIDVGPGAGVNGGTIVHSGPVNQLHTAKNSRTARFLEAPARILKTHDGARTPSATLDLTGVRARNLNLDLSLPLSTFNVISGVSGAGKTTLLTSVLGGLDQAEELDEPEPEDAAETRLSTDQADPEPTIESTAGAEAIDRIITITQKPIGRTPRSTVATYTGLFDRIRRIFANTDQAKAKKYTVSKFSYNTPAGRCPECNGLGQIEVELIFLPGSYATCPVCHGARFNPETLAVTYQDKNIAEVLALSITDAQEFFADDARITRGLKALQAIGLGYLTLGQSATELSGGEAQRIKLATELQRAQRGHTIYLLDEPTSGLHPADVELLIAELNRLTDHGNTVVVAEHDRTVIAQADHVIDLDDGAIIAEGTPADIAANKQSVTGQWLSRA